MIISLKDSTHITVTNSYVVLRFLLRPAKAMPVGANHRVRGFILVSPKNPGLTKNRNAT